MANRYSVPLLSALIFLSCFTCIHSADLTFNEPGFDETIVLASKVECSDGTLVLRFGKADPGDAYCFAPEMQYRIIRPDGSVATLPLNFTFPAASRCSYYLDTTNEADGIRMYSMPYNRLFITYVDATTYTDVSTYVDKGILVSFNGDIIGDPIIFGTAYNYVGDKGPTAKAGALIRNIGNVNEFLFVQEAAGDGVSVYYKWQRFTEPNAEGIITPIDQRVVVQEPTLGQLWSTTFATRDGGYALVGAYTVVDDTAADKKPKKAPPVPAIAPVDIRTRCEVTFFRPLTNDTIGPFLIYQTSVAKAWVDPMDCSNSALGVGYLCVATVEIPIGKTQNSLVYYQAVRFLSSGSVTETRTLPVDPKAPPGSVDVRSMPFGGYMLVEAPMNAKQTQYIVTSQLLNDDGTVSNKALNIPQPLVFNVINNVVIDVFFPNNSWGFVSRPTATTFRLTEYDIPKLWNDDVVGLDNPNIRAIWPLINGSISPNDKVNVSYNVPIIFSTQSLSVYQVNPNSNDSSGDYLRQRCSARDLSCNILIQNDTIEFTPLSSTFNTPGVQYYVAIDSDYVKQSNISEAVPGILNRQWQFQASVDSGTFSDSVTGLLRLNLDESQHFDSLNNDGKSAFFDDLTNALVDIIPVEPSRLTTSKLFQTTTVGTDDLVLISYTIKKTTDQNQRSANDLANDLDTLVKYKSITPVGMNNSTKFLDETYGFQRTQNLWDKYKTRLLILFLALLVVLVLFILARIRNNEGHNWAIIQIALIILDTTLDILFLADHGRDIHSLYLPSVIFLVVPIGFNAISAFLIFNYEHEHNSSFLKWSNRNVKLAPTFTVLAGADIEMLNVLASGLAGLNLFSAPFSRRALRWIFWVSTVNVIIEDIPQVIIQIIYKTRTVSYDIVPFLTLITSCVVLLVNLLGKVYFVVHYIRHREFRYSVPVRIMERETTDSVEEKAATEDYVPTPRTSQDEDRFTTTGSDEQSQEYR
ncbi:1287_t:CDS:10 [Paraglomus occultum]|uniref:1287_t:CDS:1 n=1 Tax=Paraglomus occultum TaxID=144539 RepID=A0A9N9D2M8_9GLOM|nr:1287_t:CDS:10 [Paraglomus occultum]